MKTRRCFLIAACGLALALASLAAPSRGPRCDISGHIAGLDSRRVQVTAKSSHKPTRSVLTRPDGSYTIQSVLPGVYTVRPADPRFRFTPSFHTVNVTHDVHGVDFRAREIPRRRR
jgi:hypothetical protein